MIREPRAWLVGSGAFVFGLSYGLAFLVGGIEALTPTPDDNPVSSDVACDSACKTQGALLLIPVAGPLLSIEHGPHNATDTKVGLWWSGIEAAGLTMLIVGLIGHDVPRALPSSGSPASARASVVPFITPAGGELAVHVAF